MACTCDHILPQGTVTEMHYDNCSSVERNHLRNDDGTIRLPNTHLRSLAVDVLYHLDFNTADHDLREMFGDVKFVCTGGTEHRMREFAQYMGGILTLPVSENLTESSKRYAMYKVGPVLAVSHGVGIPSMTTVIQEVIKMLAYAKVKDPIIIRLGSCGGVGVEAGCVVISSSGFNGELKESYNTVILGNVQMWPTSLDMRVAQEIKSMSLETDGFKTYIGGTMAADDFYQGQGRLDGPICDYTKEQKMEFLRKAYKKGIRNIEMEATALAAFTKKVGIRSAICCAPFLDRLEGDQVTSTFEERLEWERRPMILVGRYIQAYVRAQM